MPAIAALLLTLALAPTPSPTATSGPVGDLLGGVGSIVDDLLDGGTPGASPTPTPSAPTTSGPPGPAASAPMPAATGSSVPSRPATSAAPARTADGRGAREAAVPLPNGKTGTPDAAPTLAAPGPEQSGSPLIPAYYLLILGALAVPVLLLLRRRPADAPGSASAPEPAPAPASAPAPETDPGPVPDNVTQLPTNLNAIYELGRLDERLEQERGRRS